MDPPKAVAVGRGLISPQNTWQMVVAVQRLGLLVLRASGNNNRCHHSLVTQTFAVHFNPQRELSHHESVEGGRTRSRSDWPCLVAVWRFLARLFRVCQVNKHSAVVSFHLIFVFLALSPVCAFESVT